MHGWHSWMACAAWVLCVASAGADDKPSQEAAATKTSDAAAVLSAALRAYALDNLPTPLYQSATGWGKKSFKPAGIKLDDKGHPELIHKERNEGTWRKLRVTAPTAAQSLVVEVRNVKPQEPDRSTFDVYVALDVNLDFTEQKWKAGIKPFDGNVRARTHVALLVNCELTSKLEWHGSFIPDMTFKCRALKSDVTYDHFVTEHIAGVGGEAARILGAVLKDSLKRWHPALEKKLLAKADAAVVKAANKKELGAPLGQLAKQRSLPASTAAGTQVKQ